MKTEKFVMMIVAFCIATMVQAQQVFNVQNGTKTAFYNDLETAVQQAVSGDTIYLPGVEIQLTNDLVIDKKLALIGAGWDVDSIGGLKRTELKKSNGSYANIYYRESSNGSLLTGCTLGGIVFGHQDEVNDFFENIEEVTIWRNDIDNIALGVSNSTANKCCFQLPFQFFYASLL